MAKGRRALETQIEGWRNFGLFLLFLLGIVGAVSYTLIVRQKTRLDMQEQRITQLTESVNDIEEKSGTVLKKR